MASVMMNPNLSDGEKLQKLGEINGGMNDMLSHAAIDAVKEYNSTVLMNNV